MLSVDDSSGFNDVLDFIFSLWSGHAVERVEFESLDAILVPESLDIDKLKGHSPMIESVCYMATKNPRISMLLSSALVFMRCVSINRCACAAC